MAAAGGAAAVAGATTFGILAVPTSILAGAGMQFYWDRTFVADLGSWAADAFGPVTWAAEGVLEGIGNGVRAVGNTIIIGTRFISRLWN